MLNPFRRVVKTKHFGFVFPSLSKNRTFWGGGQPSSGRNVQLLKISLRGVGAEKNEIISLFP